MWCLRPRRASTVTVQVQTDQIILIVSADQNNNHTIKFRTLLRLLPNPNSILSSKSSKSSSMTLNLTIFFLVLLFVTNGICPTPDFDFDVEVVISELLRGQNEYNILNIKRTGIRSLIKGSYDPDLYLNTTELIRSKGFTCEEHRTETEDGFILGLQRILPKRKSLISPAPVVFLQHGLLDSSSTWVINHPNQSLGFLLSDVGCDVWLGNVRGNTYSRSHKNLYPRNSKFWNWSWDEMAKYDIPAMIGYISDTTSSRNITYIGHSQGTLVAFASLSRNPELQQVVTKLFALAPVAVLGNIRGFLKYLAKFAAFPKAIFSLLGVHEFMPSSPLVRWIAGNLCPKILLRDVCATLVLMGGLSDKNTNMTRVPVYVSHEPSGTSVKNMHHFAQLVNSKKFQMYDYLSSKENLEHYNQTKPPLYNLRDITIPTYVFYGDQDELSTPKDSLEVIQNITNLAYVEEIPDYEHMDFIWGIHTAEDVYKKIISFIGAA